jgi:SHS2 domain-containing protein
VSQGASKGIQLPYDLLDHTADLGLRIQARDLPELFETAAVALGEQLVEAPKAADCRHRRIEVSGEDWADLLINWLRELLACWHLDAHAVRRARCVALSPFKLSADVAFLPFDPAIHSSQQEIKAVTYHQLDVSPSTEGWQATVIFDL